MQNEWLRYLVCGNKTKLQIREDTELKNSPFTALLLQLSKPVSDALSFWRCAMYKSEIPLQKVKICAMGVFRSGTPRAYYPPKKKFCIQINIFPLFLLARAKTREIYIRLEHKTGETP